MTDGGHTPRAQGCGLFRRRGEQIQGQDVGRPGQIERLAELRIKVPLGRARAPCGIGGQAGTETPKGADDGGQQSMTRSSAAHLT